MNTSSPHLFFTLLEIDAGNVIAFIALGCISLAISYYIMKAAVKNGVIEANEFINGPTTFGKPTREQEQLKEKYLNGEIKFEEYKKEWGKLTGK